MNPADRLRERCREGLARLDAHGVERQAEAGKRLDAELLALDRAGRAPGMVAAAEIADFARGHDVGLGPGRGSVSGSLVAYLAGITDVDPMEHGLLFERFLVEARRPTFIITLDIEANGHDLLRGRLEALDPALRGTIRILVSEEADVLYRASRRAWPSQRADKALSGLPLDDPDVLDWLEQGPADGLLTSTLPDVQRVRRVSPAVRSFGDVIVMMRFLHFMPDAANTGLLQRFASLQRTSSTEPGWPGPLEGLIAETRGMLLYQEQAMQVMNEMAGINLLDAFELLRAMRSNPEPVHQAFLTGCDGRGHNPGRAEHAWTRLACGSARACKAHLTGFALTNYRMAFLKVHHSEACNEAPGLPESGRKGET